MWSPAVGPLPWNILLARVPTEKSRRAQCVAGRGVSWDSRVPISRREHGAARRADSDKVCRTNSAGFTREQRGPGRLASWENHATKPFHEHDARPGAQILAGCGSPARAQESR